MAFMVWQLILMWNRAFVYNVILPGLITGSHSGDNGDEDPPVPIPNTEVKLVRGESTWHIAPGRITRCRISIINDRFQAENGHFSCILKIFCPARFIFFVARFLLGKSGFLV